MSKLFLLVKRDAESFQERYRVSDERVVEGLKRVKDKQKFFREISGLSLVPQAEGDGPKPVADEKELTFVVRRTMKDRLGDILKDDRLKKREEMTKKYREESEKPEGENEPEEEKMVEEGEERFEVEMVEPEEARNLPELQVSEGRVVNEYDEVEYVVPSWEIRQYEEDSVDSNHPDNPDNDYPDTPADSQENSDNSDKYYGEDDAIYSEDEERNAYMKKFVKGLKPKKTGKVSYETIYRKLMDYQTQN